METEFAPFWLSMRVSCLATAAVVALGVPIAFGLARWSFRGKALAAGVLMLPIVLPPTVVGYLLLVLLGRRSTIGGWLEATTGFSPVFHWSGEVIAAACSAFPLFLLPARSAFEEVDPALEDAARLLGRGEASVFRHITLPLAWRGLIAGLMLAFARSLGDFGASMMVAGDIPGRTRTASMAIYDAAMFAGDPARAARLSVAVSAVSIAALIVVQRTLPARRAGSRMAL